jgi:hypothetical protein
MLAEMVATFLPLVKQLVKAGLLTMSINIDDIGDLHKHSTLDGEPTVVFDNGNIWIDTEYAGGNLRKRARKAAGTRRLERATRVDRSSQNAKSSGQRRSCASLQRNSPHPSSQILLAAS